MTAPPHDFWDFSAHGFFDYANLLLPFLVGLGTVVVLTFQLRILKQADMTSRRQAEISAEQSSISKRQADISDRQAQLSERQFLIEHRPKLIVRTVFVDFANGKPRGLARFIVTNVGTRSAEISEVGTCGITRASWDFIDWTKLQFNRDQSAFSLESGQEKICIAASNSDLLSQQLPGSYTVYCIGYVKYRADGDELDRVTGFFWKWDKDHNLWVREPNDQFEYAY